MTAVPPADEQAAIVKYLAHANARIDKAIAAKRRLIALLGEYRGEVIDTLVLGRREWIALRRPLHGLNPCRSAGSGDGAEPLRRS